MRKLRFTEEQMVAVMREADRESGGSGGRTGRDPRTNDLPRKFFAATSFITSISRSRSATSFFSCVWPDNNLFDKLTLVEARHDNADQWPRGILMHRRWELRGVFRPRSASLIARQCREVWQASSMCHRETGAACAVAIAVFRPLESRIDRYQAT
jgi:hypothetical protein